jgi:glycosyltransferase involved in cell wall biosynthesis
MKKRLKILNLIDIPWSSAVADYALAQCEVLSKKGHEIYFGASKESFSFKAAKEKGYKVMPFSDRKKILTPIDIFSLVSFCKKEKIDIINAHTGRALTAAAAAKVFCPFLKTVRIKADAKTPSVNLISKSVSLIICGSKHIEKMYSQKAPNLPLKTIYKGEKEIKQSPLPISPPFKIGLLGRLDPVKGHSVLIKAGIYILEKGKDCLFYFAGKEENIQWKKLEDLIPSKFKSKFSYLGKTENPRSFIESCHIGVIPSLSSEAVSRAALEWISAGRPLICSNTGSLGEYVSEKFLFRPGDYEELSSKLEELLSKNEIEKTALENFNKATNLFSFEKFSQDTEKAFLELF